MHSLLPPSVLVLAPMLIVFYVLLVIDLGQTVTIFRTGRGEKNSVLRYLMTRGSREEGERNVYLYFAACALLVTAAAFVLWHLLPQWRWATVLALAALTGRQGASCGWNHALGIRLWWKP